MFMLTSAEAERLVSQSVIPPRRSLGAHLHYVFTQEGVAIQVQNSQASGTR